jgi:hypothetical protein
VGKHRGNLSLNLELMMRRMGKTDPRSFRPESFMSIVFGKYSLSIAAVMVFGAAAALPAGAADLVRGYYPPAAKSQRHYVRTAYANEECGLLKVTQSGYSRIVRICSPVLDLRPAPTRGTSSGDAGNGSSFTVTQQ